MSSKNNTRWNKWHYLVFLLLLFSITACKSQNTARSLIISEAIHAESLENTITNESPDRRVTVYLPPSYTSNLAKRYPVVYLLHGIAGTDQDWMLPGAARIKYGNIKNVMDEGITNGQFGEMIIVMPDQNTNWFGSFYTNSSVTGNWEDFTTEELVHYIDTKYRTLSQPASRGIAGHSMGGYGAISLAMKRPDVYSVVYGLSPALIDFTADFSATNPIYEKASMAKSFDDLRKTQDRMAMAVITVAQAFSPNPMAPPFYVDFPFILEGGQMVPNPAAYSKWQEKSVLNMLGKYHQNLSKLKGICFDVGNQDEFEFIIRNTKKFSQALRASGINHEFEVYKGDHRNQLWGSHGRLHIKLLPYFWNLLSHE